MLIPKDLKPWSLQQWLRKLLASRSVAGGVCGTVKAVTDRDTFVLGKLTLQARLSVSWFLTVHMIKYFSVQGDECFAYRKLHFCLAEEMQFGAVTPFYRSLMDICVLPG